MKMYHRWLLSYLPVFLTIVSILIFLFFTVLGNYSKQQAIKANEVFAGNFLQTTDSILQFSEQVLLKEILTNDRIRLFFDGDKWSDPYENYLLSQRVRKGNKATGKQGREPVSLFCYSNMLRFSRIAAHFHLNENGYHL
jgi:hypothetical protein